MPHRNYRIAVIVLFAGLLALIGLTYRDYGVSWDERLHLTYSANLVNYYRGLLGADVTTEATTYQNLYYYGGAFDLPVAVAVRLLGEVLPYGKMELRHLLNALVGLLGIVGAWAAARQLGGDKAGFWAASLLATTPVYYGHIFFNPKDIPFAVGYIWALFFLLKLLRHPEGVRWGTLVGFGLVAGLTMGIRVGGMLLITYLFLVLVWNFWRSSAGGLEGSGQTAKSWPWRELGRQVLLPGAIAGLIAYLVMLAFWPWAQQDPLRNPFIALGQFSQFDFPFRVLYRGQEVLATELPLDYLFTYMAITLPEILLILLAAGGVWAGVRAAQMIRKKELPSQRYVGGVLLLMAILIPILTALVGRSTLYDGMRHFIFIVPPLACLAGMTFQTILDWVARKGSSGDRISPRGSSAARPLREGILVVLVGIVLVYQAAVMIYLHPYEYIYYNRLVGGVSGASGKYEAEYWGTAVGESARWLVDHLAEQGELANGPVRVFIGCADEFSAYYYFPEQVEWTPHEAEADYYIISNRWECLEEVPGHEIQRVERFGVPLSIVTQVER